MKDITNCENQEKCVTQLISDLILKSNELSKDVKLPKKQWLMFYRFQTVLHYFPEPQPKTVCDDEAKEIVTLKLHHDYSMRELGFVFQRSPATILKVLKDAKIATTH